MAVVVGAGVQYARTHRQHRLLDRLRYVAVADRPTMQPPMSRALSPRLGSVGQPLPSRVARSSAGSRRSAASINNTAPSATDGALAPGMFATAMPRRVAAPTS